MVFNATLMLKIISQFEFKHIMMLRIKTITSVLMISACNIFSITTHPIGLDLHDIIEILLKMALNTIDLLDLLQY